MEATRATAAASQGSSHSLESPGVLVSEGGGGTATAGEFVTDGLVGAVVASGIGESDGAGAIAAGAGLETVAEGLVARRWETATGAVVADRRAGARVGASAGGLADVGVAVVAAGVSSAGRVFVPGRLKFCSSRGPTASVAGVVVFVVAGCTVF